MKKLIAPLVIILLINSCETDLNLGSISSEITQDYLLTGDLDLYLDNQQIFRFTGKPGTTTIPIGLESLSDFEDCFILHISTGSESDGNVKNAIVSIDGQLILNKSDFGDRVFQYDFEICNLTPDSYIEIVVKGKPGSYLDIWIEGKLKNLYPCPGGTFVDARDGQEYDYVCIGDQIWMAENLNTTKYNNGDPVLHITDNSEWGNTGEGAYCYYNNDENNKDIYGALYNYFAVVDSRELCPSGWHIPSDNEWKTLEIYLGLTESEADLLGWRGTDVGLKMKSKTGWLNDGNGTNSSGFNALPGGNRYYDGSSFAYLGLVGLWWSSTLWVDNGIVYDWALRRYLDYSQDGIDRANDPLHYGFSVRCVKD